jgi:hypothetical protein
VRKLRDRAVSRRWESSQSSEIRPDRRQQSSAINSGRASQPLAGAAGLPSATEQQVRAHAAELIELAARHEISGPAFTSPGRLRSHVAADRYLFSSTVFTCRKSTARIPAAWAVRN